MTINETGKILVPPARRLNPAGSQQAKEPERYGLQESASKSTEQSGKSGKAQDE
jgi:hypothetical protein